MKMYLTIVDNNCNIKNIEITRENNDSMILDINNKLGGCDVNVVDIGKVTAKAQVFCEVTDRVIKYTLTEIRDREKRGIQMDLGVLDIVDNLVTQVTKEIASEMNLSYGTITDKITVVIGLNKKGYVIMLSRYINSNGKDKKLFNHFCTKVSRPYKKYDIPYLENREQRMYEMLN